MDKLQPQLLCRLTGWPAVAVEAEREAFTFAVVDVIRERRALLVEAEREL